MRDLNFKIKFVDSSPVSLSTPPPTLPIHSLPKK